jgi:hypothetical protein
MQKRIAAIQELFPPKSIAFLLLLNPMVPADLLYFGPKTLRNVFFQPCLIPSSTAGSLCRPNSHPVCETSDFEDLGPNCKYLGKNHEPAINRAGPLNDNCTGSIFCKCDPGFVREHPEKYAK